MVQAHVYRSGRREDGPVDLAGAKGALAGPGAFVWLDAVDPSDGDLLEIQATLGLHPLTVEDALHRGQRTRAELFPDYGFLVLRPVRPDGAGGWAEGEVHALVSAGFLCTLRFGPDPFDAAPSQRRFERQPEMLARHGGGFAVWALADEVVDGYLEAVESLEEAADLLEDDVFAILPPDGDSDLQERIFRHKREAVRIRRLAAPLRPSLDLLQEEPDLVGPELQPYFRDLADHILRVTELVDNVRDLLTALLEVRMAQVANHLNEVMKKLSAWAGIILVPTLIAGIYGMNFRHMPELGWTSGYPFALGVMAAAAGALFWAFRRKGWL